MGLPVPPPLSLSLELASQPRGGPRSHDSRLASLVWVPSFLVCRMRTRGTGTFGLLFFVCVGNKQFECIIKALNQGLGLP